MYGSKYDQRTGCHGADCRPGTYYGLEKKGFIEFRTDARDRRCKRIYILQKGLELEETMRRTIQASEERMVQGFTEQEKEQFSTLLTRAIANMDGNPCNHSHKEETDEC